MRNLLHFFFVEILHFLTSIVIAMVISAITLFTTNVLFNADLSYWPVSRWLFIFIFGFSTFVEIVDLINKHLLIARTARRIGKPYSAVDQAIIQYEIQRTTPIEEWTGENFDTLVQIHIISKMLTQHILDALDRPQ